MRVMPHLFTDAIYHLVSSNAPTVEVIVMVRAVVGNVGFDSDVVKSQIASVIMQLKHGKAEDLFILLMVQMRFKDC